ncbi:hypothetical protein WR25_17358 isoform C [Diploscapter pachys]|uniref:ShKT domain-containing protein n=1 Tax=Diploscapter pachys TaxID=2018661 RepID=A0A2A2KT76_9BILA|nr:hypothetical protein WR25_17358 isoform C [Diploscapter pachys]
MRRWLHRAALLLLPLGVFTYNCSHAPDKDMVTICKMMYEMDAMQRKSLKKRQAWENSIGAPGVPNNNWLSPAVPQRFSPSAQGCMNIPCICPYMGGRVSGNNGCTLPNGQPYLMALRKEYRMMTDNERQRWHSALQQLKRSGEYDRMSAEHRTVGSNSGAHSGPGFLAWHREFVKRIEIAVRMLDPGIAMPYWDSVMDNYLPDPRDSILFSPLFMGETDSSGLVTNGPFAFFRTLEGRNAILRRLAIEGKLFSEQAINNILAQPQVTNMQAYTAPQAGCPFQPQFGAMEYAHSSVHLWIGGDMKPPSTAANDPIFFIHHGFVDFVWEMWRQNHQNRWQRESTWPPDIATCSNPQHFSYANMRPWDKTNKDGLSNEYTDFLYRFAPRATCSQQNPSCGSPYLFCDTRWPAHCVAKVKQGGLCRGFEGFDVCYNGVCVAGWCRPGQFAGAPTTRALTTVTQPSTTRRTWAPFTTQFRTTTPRSTSRWTTMQRTTSGSRTTPSSLARSSGNTGVSRSFDSAILSNVNCYNDDPCCDAWARTGECQTNGPYMRTYCRRSCRLCSNPTDNRRGCHDRHISCPFWRSQNYCTRRRQWMAENCQVYIQLFHI